LNIEAIHHSRTASLAVSLVAAANVVDN